METTIAIKERTAQILMMLKDKMEARSIDETINRILQKTEKISASRFGSNPKLKEFSEKERAGSHEL